METFAQRANFLLGYNPQSSSPTTPSKHPDIDFNDVFGGPPRRSSKQETRFSFTESMDSAKNGEVDAVSPRNPWSGHNEMPVFGDESVNHRRYPSDDFFDDIFRGEESVSSPRRSIHDPFGSAPGSRVLSPSRPLPPPRADPSGGSLSAQFQFSLPAKLSKAMDSSVFASANRSSYKYKDPTSNGMSFSYTPSSPLSRLSSETFQEENALKNQFRLSYRPSPLSREFSHSSKEASSMTKSDELESTNMGDSLNKDLKSTEVTSNISQFHFSIYKWASKGVPLLMPLRGGNTTKSKERLKIERCSNSNGRIENENLTNGLKTENWCDSEPHFFNHSVSANNEPAYDEGRKQDSGSRLETNPEDRAETSCVVEAAVLSKSGSKSTKKFPNIVETVDGHDISSQTIEDIKSHSLSKTGFKSTEKGSDMHIQVAQKEELKSVKSLFYDSHEELGNDELTRKSEGEDSKVKKKTVSDSNTDVCENVKKHNEKKFNSSRAEVIQVNEPYSQDSRRTSCDNLGRNGVKGKVKEFVKIFNQEAFSKPKIDKEPRSQSSRWRSTSTFGADKEGKAKTAETSGKNHVHRMNKIRTPPNTSFMVDKNIESDKQQPHLKTRVFNVNENSFGQKDVSAATSESLPDASKVTVGNIDDLFRKNFMIKELSNDQDELPQMENGYGDIQTSDAKIWQWSKGKEGNIRSLLSTLHYVLWPGSGWKAVPLVDIIEGSAVKRAYQKALLCLHPDKLQQKNAAPPQKYIAEKVFDILQEAWGHFNSLGAI